jgi:hypothetical protein
MSRQISQPSTCLANDPNRPTEPEQLEITRLIRIGEPTHPQLEDMLMSAVGQHNAGLTSNLLIPSIPWPKAFAGIVKPSTPQ